MISEIPKAKSNKRKNNKGPKLLILAQQIHNDNFRSHCSLLLPGFQDICRTGFIDWILFCCEMMRHVPEAQRATDPAVVTCRWMLGSKWKHIDMRWITGGNNNSTSHIVLMSLTVISMSPLLIGSLAWLISASIEFKKLHQKITYSCKCFHHWSHKLCL